jgi:hypothetical protein
MPERGGHRLGPAGGAAAAPRRAAVVQPSCKVWEPGCGAAARLIQSNTVITLKRSVNPLQRSQFMALSVKPNFFGWVPLDGLPSVLGRLDWASRGSFGVSTGRPHFNRASAPPFKKLPGVKAKPCHNFITLNRVPSFTAPALRKESLCHSYIIKV